MGDVIPIGQLSRKTGVEGPTIRYYESVGLLRPPPRSEGDRRLYWAGRSRSLALHPSSRGS